jgi:NodT family efflux transporter outer membrane factor (OMF) lipoprotein
LKFIELESILFRHGIPPSGTTRVMALTQLRFVSPTTAVRMFALAACMFMLGCAVGPDYRRPDAPRVDRYTARPLPDATVKAEAADGDAQRFLKGRDVPQHWWTSFGNAELDRRVRMALEHSPSMASAQSALRQAQENAMAAGGALFPALDAGAGAAREKLSAAQLGTPGGVRPFTLFNASVNVRYTLDLFGGVRRGIEASRAQSDVQKARLDSTYLTLAGNVVTASLQEASLREQIRATRQIIDMQRKTLAITERQQEIGASSFLDTLAIRAQLGTSEAALPPLRARLAAVRNQLATYLGVTPAQLQAAPVTLDAVELPRAVPVSLPSRLVEQRPDIRAASAQLHAASAEVGVATAAMLPQITLSGSGGSQALSAGDLFSAGTRAWSLGLNLTQPLFHGGALLHGKRAAQAALDQATANWQQTVLVAFQNVADALDALQYDAQTLAAQAVAERAASQRLALAREQYRIGATGYLDLLDAERSDQQARIALVQARAARLTDTAALYTALGGGWRNKTRTTPPAAPAHASSTASN